MQLGIQPIPPRVGFATATIRLSDGQGRPVASAKVLLEGNMSHPGMAPLTASTMETGAGVYQGHLSIPMAGDWVFTAHITLADGRKLDRQTDVPGVQPN
jgi:hypothetical protein